MAIKGVLSHFSAKHEHKCARQSLGGFTTNAWCIDPTRMEQAGIKWDLVCCRYQDHVFFHGFEMRGKTFHAWTMIFADPAEAEDYRVEISLEKDGTEFKMTDGTVYPIDVPRQEIFKSVERHLVCSTEVAKEFLTTKDVKPQKAKKGFTHKLFVNYNVTKVR